MFKLLMILLVPSFFIHTAKSCEVTYSKGHDIEEFKKCLWSEKRFRELCDYYNELDVETLNIYSIKNALLSCYASKNDIAVENYYAHYVKQDHQSDIKVNEALLFFSKDNKGQSDNQSGEDKKKDNENNQNEKKDGENSDRIKSSGKEYAFTQSESGGKSLYQVSLEVGFEKKKRRLKELKDKIKRSGGVKW